MPRSAPFQREPVDWVDMITRTAGVAMFAALYLAWLAYQFSGVLKTLDIIS